MVYYVGMKKILLMLTAIAVLTLSSCSGARYAGTISVTPMPAMQGDVQVVTIDSNDEKSNTDEKFDENYPEAKEAFEQLRASLHEAMSVIASEEEISFSQLEHMLLDYSGDTIIVSSVISGWPFELDYEGSEIYEDMELPENTEIKFITANKLSLEDGKIVDYGTSTTPILIATENNSTKIKQMYVPEMFDEEVRSEELNQIFGDKLEYIDFPIDSYKKYESSQRISKVLYNTAISGGFDGFPNKIIDIVKALDESPLLDDTTNNGAILKHLINTSFSYSSITIPFWYDFFNEDKYLEYETMRYVAQSNYTIELSSDGADNIFTETVPSRYYVIENNGKLFCRDYYFVQFMYETDVERINEVLDEYATDYYEFIESSNYMGLLYFGHRVTAAILNGAFDYKNDSLIYTPKEDNNP